jgi:hypothetical protein
MSCSATLSVPTAHDVNGREIGAACAVLRSVLSMIEQGATHIGVATDHLVESFRIECMPDTRLELRINGRISDQGPFH